MRGTFTFAFLLASILVVVAGAAHLAGASIITAVVACACGAIFTMLAAIIVNTRNAAIYGRTVWEDQGGMDGVARHADHMRRDRVVRHAEAPATFPAGDVA